jgi:hypothetical protein
MGKAGKMGAREVRMLAMASVLFAGFWVLLNLAKPLHIDDPLFLYWAQTIAPLPGEKPVEFVNWEFLHEPLMNQVHPWAPGWSLLLSAVRHAFGGDRESLYHLLQWPFSAMFLAGSALLAARFSVSPWIVLALCATSPVFLLSSSSASADMAGAGPVMLGFALWLGAGTLRQRIIAGLLVALGGQMKQTMLPLLPMLFLVETGGLLQGGRNWAVALVVCLLAGTYPGLPPAGSTEGSIWDQVMLIFNWSSSLGGFYMQKAGYGLAVLSALLVSPAAFLLLFFRGKEPRPAFGAFKVLVVTAILAVVLVNHGIWAKLVFGRGQFQPVPHDLTAAWFVSSFAVFTAWFLGQAWWGRLAGKSRRWLLAWLVLVLAASIIGTPFPAARFLVFALPPLAIVAGAGLLRNLDPGLARIAVGLTVLGNIWLGGGLAKSDYDFAVFNRDAATQAMVEAENLRLPLWTTGQWGLRWYVEKSGGFVVGEATEKLPRGALLVAPRITDHRRLAPGLARRVVSRSAIECPPPSGIWRLLAPARTLGSAGSSAGYHGGHVWLPYTFSRSPLETADFLVIRPSRGGK